MVETEEILEYDVIVEIPKDRIHLFGFILEGWDNLANLRHADLENAVRIIVPKDRVEELLDILEVLCEHVGAKIRKIKPFSFPL